MEAICIGKGIWIIWNKTKTIKQQKNKEVSAILLYGTLDMN